jgi:hypothetical protein
LRGALAPSPEHRGRSPSPNATCEIWGRPHKQRRRRNPFLRDRSLDFSWRGRHAGTSERSKSLRGITRPRSLHRLRVNPCGSLCRGKSREPEDESSHGGESPPVVPGLFTGRSTAVGDSRRDAARVRGDRSCRRGRLAREQRALHPGDDARPGPQLPGLDIVACHFGGYRLLDTAEEMLVGLPVSLDTSWPPALASLDPGRVRRLIERHGPERIVFGSDWPMADPAREIETIRALGLSHDDTAGILGRNVPRMLDRE